MKNRIVADHEPAGSQPGPRSRTPVSKSRSVVALQDMEVQPERAGRGLQIPDMGFGIGGIGRVVRGRQRWSPRAPARVAVPAASAQLQVQVGNTREVAARPVHAGDKAEFDRVAP